MADNTISTFDPIESTVPVTTATTKAETTTEDATSTLLVTTTAPGTKITDTLEFKIGVGVGAGVLAIIIIVIIVCLCRKSKNPRIARMRKDTLSGMNSIRQRFRGSGNSQSNGNSMVPNSEQSNGHSNNVATFTEDPTPPTKVTVERQVSPPGHIPSGKRLPGPDMMDPPRNIEHVEQSSNDDDPPPPGPHAMPMAIPGYIHMANKTKNELEPKSSADIQDQNPKGNPPKTGNKPLPGNSQTESPNLKSKDLTDTKRQDLRTRKIPPPPNQETTPKAHKVPNIQGSGYINTGEYKERHNPEANLAAADGDDDEREDYENQEVWISQSEPNLHNIPLSVAQSPKANKGPGPVSPKPKIHGHDLHGSSPNVSNMGKPSPRPSPKPGIAVSKPSPKPGFADPRPSPKTETEEQVVYDNVPLKQSLSKNALKQSVPVAPDSSPTGKKNDYYNLQSGYQNLPVDPEKAASQKDRKKGLPNYH